MNIKVEPQVTNLMLPYTHVEFRLFTDLHFQNQDGQSGWEYTFLSSSPYAAGEFDASGNYYVQWSDAGDEATIHAKVDLNTGVLTEFNITYVDDYSTWGEIDYATIKLANLEPDFVSDTELEYYEEYSADVCDYIVNIDYREEFSTGDYSESVDWRCNGDSRISVRFYVY
jgi:hypothetical protein